MALRSALRENQECLWLVLIIAAALVLRAAAIGALTHTPESDEVAYGSMALNLVHGDGIVDWKGNRAMYNVGYPLFVLAPVFAVFGTDILVVRLVNAFLGGLGVALCYLVAKEAGAGRTGRLLAAVIWTVYLPASVFPVYLLKENLMTPLMLGVIWCALRLENWGSHVMAVACGVLFGLLALTGSAGLCLAAPVGLALVFSSTTLGRKSSHAGLILASAVLVAAPWVVRNMQVLGAPVLNTNAGFNLYLGNNPAATGMFVSIAQTPRGATWNELRKDVGEVRASETLGKEAVGWIKEHPTAFLALALRKAAYFWTPPFHEGEAQTSKIELVVRALWAIQYLVILAAAVGTLFIASTRNRRIAILWFALASYTAVHMLFYVIFRYRLPIMPFVGVLAAATVERLLLRWRLAGPLVPSEPATRNTSAPRY